MNIHLAQGSIVRDTFIVLISHYDYGKLFHLSWRVESIIVLAPKGGITMENLPTNQEIVQRLKNLSLEQQRKVLGFILELSGEPPKKYPGKNLLQLVGTISKEDLEIMKQAIEEGCEQIDESEW